MVRTPSDLRETSDESKAHQRHADGTSSEWIGAAGTRQPAPVTKLTAATVGGTQGDDVS